MYKIKDEMEDYIMGLTLSIICAIFVAMIASLIIGECTGLYMSDLEIPEKIVREESNSDNYWESRLYRYKEKVKECRNAWLLRIVVPAAIGILVMFGCFYIGYRVNMSYVKSYEAKVATYNAAIENNNIEGLEKLCLVENIASLNSSIVQAQETASRWYGFLIPKEIYNIELVDLSKVQ